MTRSELVENIRMKESFLCIGLDSDTSKIPKHILNSEFPQYEFNKQIIDATQNYCVAYKLNTAFYEAEGLSGWASLEKTINYLNENCKDIFTIADAKRGDIGNTSSMYAKAFYEKLNFDSITIAPYMGEDSVTPFLEYKNKFAIILAHTSNQGADDFQTLISENKMVYETVIEKSKQWGTPDNMMYVVGATKSETLVSIRQLIPEHFLLVPGIGAQGGNLQEVAKCGMTEECGLLVNSSRSIIFASSDETFASKAKQEAMNLQKEMKIILENF